MRGRWPPCSCTARPIRTITSRSRRSSRPSCSSVASWRRAPRTPGATPWPACWKSAPRTSQCCGPTRIPEPRPRSAFPWVSWLWATGSSCVPAKRSPPTASSSRASVASTPASSPARACPSRSLPGTRSPAAPSRPMAASSSRPPRSAETPCSPGSSASSKTPRPARHRSSDWLIECLRCSCPSCWDWPWPHSWAGTSPPARPPRRSAQRSASSWSPALARSDWPPRWPCSSGAGAAPSWAP